MCVGWSQRAWHQQKLERFAQACCPLTTPFTLSSAAESLGQRPRKHGSTLQKGAASTPLVAGGCVHTALPCFSTIPLVVDCRPRVTNQKSCGHPGV